MRPSLRPLSLLLSLLLTAVLAYTLSACTSPANPAPAALEPALSLPAEDPAVTAAAPEPDEFTATPEPSPTVPQPTATLAANVHYYGVSFWLDPAIAAGAQGEVLPAWTTDDGYDEWYVKPESRTIALEDYLLSMKFHDPVISVYPAKEYEAVSEAGGLAIQQLKTMLAAHPDDVEKMPFLPAWNAVQFFHSNVAYVDFQNGSGVRYLSLYAQMFTLINNKDIFYTYQGLTADGKYYVSIVLPVTHPSLPADHSAIPGGDLNAFFDTYPEYLKTTVLALNAQPDESFAPGLELLDLLVSSLKIE